MADVLKTSDPVKDRRKIDIELMRIFAAFFVIFNHTGDLGFFLFSRYDGQDLKFWVYLFLSIFCKFSVPLFFMISGALMLHKETASYKALWKNKICHMLLVLVVWSLVYYFLEVSKGSAHLGFSIFVQQFFTRDWNYAFWYLYAYIPFLMTVPILQKISKALSNKEYGYLFALALVFSSVIPMAQYLLWQDDLRFNAYFNLNWLCAQVLLFPLLGYFLQHRLADFWNLKRIAVLWLINIGLILLACGMTWYRASVMGVVTEWDSQLFHESFVMVTAASVFVTCQYFVGHVRIPGTAQKILVSLGGATFGVYLTHLFVQELFVQTGLFAFFYKVLPINAMLRTLLYCVSVFGVSCLITVILKRIPVLKKFVS